MEENQSTENFKIFGIIGFIISILALIFSLIPCIGYYAMIPAILALIFSGICFYNLNKLNKNDGLTIAGLVLSILAILISFFQYYTFKGFYDLKNDINKKMDTISSQSKDSLKNELKNVIEKALLDELKKDSLNVEIDSTTSEK